MSSQLASSFLAVQAYQVYDVTPLGHAVKRPTAMLETKERGKRPPQKIKPNVLIPKPTTGSVRRLGHAQKTRPRELPLSETGDKEKRKQEIIAQPKNQAPVQGYL